MSGIMKLDDDIWWSRYSKKIQNLGPELDDIHDDLIDLDPEGWFTPETEHVTIHMDSFLFFPHLLHSDAYLSCL